MAKFITCNECGIKKSTESSISAIDCDYEYSCEDCPHNNECQDSCTYCCDYCVSNK